MHTSVSNPNQFHDLVAQLHTCLNIVDDLDLNTRIWTKN